MRSVICVVGTLAFVALSIVPVFSEECGDVNGDCKVLASDALLVLKKAVGLVEELECSLSSSLEARVVELETLLAAETVARASADDAEATERAAADAQLSADVCSALTDDESCDLSDALSWVREYNSISRPVQVAAGTKYTCAINSLGAVGCWGDAGKNASGDGPSPPAGTFTEVSAGYSHTCAINSSGTVECWGDDYYGESSPPPGTFTEVAAGGYHTCAINSFGSVACWGRDNYGQSSPPLGWTSYWQPSLLPVALSRN